MFELLVREITHITHSAGRLLDRQMISGMIEGYKWMGMCTVVTTLMDYMIHNSPARNIPGWKVY